LHGNRAAAPAIIGAESELRKSNSLREVGEPCDARPVRTLGLRFVSLKNNVACDHCEIELWQASGHWLFGNLRWGLKPWNDSFAVSRSGESMSACSEFWLWRASRLIRDCRRRMKEAFLARSRRARGEMNADRAGLARRAPRLCCPGSAGTGLLSGWR